MLAIIESRKNSRGLGERSRSVCPGRPRLRIILLLRIKRKSLPESIGGQVVALVTYAGAGKKDRVGASPPRLLG